LPSCAIPTTWSLRQQCVANGRNFLATSPAAYGRLLPIGLSS
jgi:hypothetical protein